MSRIADGDGTLRVSMIAGTRVVLMALDINESAHDVLRGFAFHVSGGGKDGWLRGTKFFEQLVPHPRKGDKYSTLQHPIQSFLWSDYEAKPDTEYEYTIVALYGAIEHLEQRHTVKVKIRTEKEDDGEHGIWFNRGVVASRAYAVTFKNKELTPEVYNAVDTHNNVTDEATVWLSRGLEEACVGFINSTPPSESLRVVAYEFTYLPLLAALKEAIKRGVKVKIIYHKTDANDKAIAAAKLAKANLIERTRPQIPHNKFMVRLNASGKPISVWTGSTNFTPTGFFGQTNVGHVVTESSGAGTTIPSIYMKYWDILSKNPTAKPAREQAVALTPNPPNAVAAKPITAVFSPRVADRLLNWYGKRIENARTSSMFTAAFTVDPVLLASLGQKQDSMRFVLLERPATKESRDVQWKNRGKVLMSNGTVLGKAPATSFEEKKGEGGTKLVPIPDFPLEKWFVDEELARKDGKGFVFFVHTKFLLIDPLSNDPLVCTGSANFSGNSLINNDENMLLIRGKTRVADIYLTEFDRIFRHFFFRMVANREALAHESDDDAKKKAVTLDTGAGWIGPYFQDGDFKNSRRLMFFADPALNWSSKALADPDVFADEEDRAKELRTKRRKKAPGS
jgi:phosphatidylserine/phosphatidylglycerophosphate/cardiolipin synthase-like enzyme